jgi:hypothetical protein
MDQTIGELVVMNLNEKEAWLAFNGFENSHLLDTSESKAYVPDAAFETILNVDGVYQVGENFYQIGEHYDFAASTKEVSYNEMKNAIVLSNNDARFIKHKIEDKVSQVHTNDPNARWTGKYGYDCYPYHSKDDSPASRTYENGNYYGDRKVTIEGWNRTYLTYATIGVRMKGWRPKRRKWTEDIFAYAKITVKTHYRPWNTANHPDNWIEEEEYDDVTDWHTVDRNVAYLAGVGVGFHLDYMYVKADVIHDHNPNPSPYTASVMSSTPYFDMEP